VVADLSGFDLLPPAKLRRQPTVAAATRDLPEPFSLAPRLAKLYGTNPLFVWNNNGQEQRLEFVLWNATKEEVFRVSVTGTSYRYPERTAPRLQAGQTYLWTVEAVSPLLGTSLSAPAGFVVVSAKEAEEIKARLTQIHANDAYEAELARARILTDHRLWYDVVAAYTDLIARYPDRAELYDERGTIYTQIGVTRTLADQDFSRADDLRAKKGPAQ
jgi:Domain of Unknown Function (DUF928)